MTEQNALQNALQGAVAHATKIQTLASEVNKLSGYYNAGELWHNEHIRALYRDVGQLSVALADAKKRGYVTRVYRLDGRHTYAYGKLSETTEPEAPVLTKPVVKTPIKMHLTISCNSPTEAFEFLTTHKFLAEGVEFQVEK